MKALLAAMMSVSAGVILGAAIQRWGDRDRATHGHKDYPPETNEDVVPPDFGQQFVGRGWLPPSLRHIREIQ